MSASRISRGGRRGVRATAKKPAKAPSLGDEVEILWPAEDKFFRGALARANQVLPYSFVVAYRDGDREVVDLDRETWRYAGHTRRRSSILSFAPGDASRLWGPVKLDTRTAWLTAAAARARSALAVEKRESQDGPISRPGRSAAADKKQTGASRGNSALRTKRASKVGREGPRVAAAQGKRKVSSPPTSSLEVGVSRSVRKSRSRRVIFVPDKMQQVADECEDERDNGNGVSLSIDDVDEEKQDKILPIKARLKRCSIGSCPR